MDLTPMLKDLEEKAKLKIPLEEGDYVGENGLMFCGKCKSAIETVVNFLGNETKVRCLCNCGAERRDKEMLLINRAKLEGDYERAKVNLGERDLLNWIKRSNYKISHNLDY